MWRRIPPGVWTLGLVSMLMDVSSELIHSLLPLFLVTVLGTSMLAVGVLEGIAESTALVTKLFSGYISDYFRKRKALAVLGYGLAALTMGLTQGVLAALVADTAPPDLRGSAFGLFNLVSGIVMLAASALAGWLWDAFGPARTFYAGATFTAVAWVGLLLQRYVRMEAMPR